MANSGNNSTNGAAKAAMMPPAAKSGTYQLKRLREIHHNILRLVAAGRRQKDVALALGVTEMMVSYTVNSDLGKQKLKVLRGEADSKTVDLISECKEISPLAVAVLEEIMLSPGAKDSDRISAAEKILNGAGYGAKKQLDINVLRITDADIQAARLAARDRSRILGLPEADIEDAQIVEEQDEKD